jgi:uncharacterized RDD family membrane protein YckC
VYTPGASQELAGLGTRLGAHLLDSLIGSAMIGGPFIVAVLIGAGMQAGQSGGNSASSGAFLGGVLFACIGFIVWAWLNYRGVAESGQSIAKKMLNIRVVRSDGSPATVGRIFWLRNVVNWLISVVPLYSIIDILFIFGEERQCLHDKLADTIVIKA